MPDALDAEASEEHDARVDIEIRALQRGDLPLLHRWLNEPGVVRWWEGDDVSWDAVVRDYAPPRDDGTEHYLSLAGGQPAGWIQCWAVGDAIDELEVVQWRALGVPTTAAGIDYLVGDPTNRGRGLGTAMIRTFTDSVVFGGHPDWTHACASPLLGNTPSWRALASAGYRHRGDFDDATFGPCRLMVRER